MHHRNREFFLDEIERILSEQSSSGQSPRALLRQRLERLFDDVLLDAKPIAETSATIVLADIRGFATIAESVPPHTLTAMLNRFFEAMGHCIERHGGVIDKFMGDAVMALFGAPERRPDDLLRALACAVDMQHSMVELNREAESRGEPRLYLGVAVNTGAVMAGSFGSQLHSEYTVIGDAVNQVARMEAFSLRGQVLLSESSQAGAREYIEVGPPKRVLVKGSCKPLLLYELRSVNHPHRLEVPQVEVRCSPRVEVDFATTLHPVAGKMVLPQAIQGRVLDLGYNGLLIRLTECLEPGAELVAILSPELGTESIGDLYLRVVRVVPGPEGFETSVQVSVEDTEGHRRIKAYVDAALWGR
jgi:adenylate cyclase